MKQFEIWLINLDPVIGSEIKKTRPCLIVSSDSYGKLPSKVILPLTSWKESYAKVPWMILVEPTATNGLERNSAIDCYQIRCVDQQRFLKKLGELPSPQQDAVFKALHSIFA